MLKSKIFNLLIGVLLSFGFVQNSKSQVLPAHAHNDYLHERPLLDALDCKFKSIEVDVFSIGDSLFVAHDFDKIKPGSTIRSLYLNPLKKIIQQNNGSVYGNDEEIILLVDFKNDGLESYKLLHQILEDFKELLTTYRLGKKEVGAVSVIVSGNRPFEYMQNQKLRYAGYDGRISELDAEIPSSLMPLVSDNWNMHFKWRGEGRIPDNEKEKLTRIANQAHKNGYLLRFWSTPDYPKTERDSVWKELKNAGVDLIGSDDLKELQKYLSN